MTRGKRGTCFFAFAGSGPSPPEVQEDIVGHTPGNGRISIVLEHRVTRFKQRAATVLIEFRAVSISSQKAETLRDAKSRCLVVSADFFVGQKSSLVKKRSLCDTFPFPPEEHGFQVTIGAVAARDLLSHCCELLRVHSFTSSLKATAFHSPSRTR